MANWSKFPYFSDHIVRSNVCLNFSAQSSIFIQQYFQMSTTNTPYRRCHTDRGEFHPNSLCLICIPFFNWHFTIILPSLSLWTVRAPHKTFRNKSSNKFLNISITDHFNYHLIGLSRWFEQNTSKHSNSLSRDYYFLIKKLRNKTFTFRFQLEFLHFNFSVKFLSR